MSIGQKKLGARPVLWTAKRFYRLLDKGFFLNRRVELIEGVIYEMAAQKNWHALGVTLTLKALENAFGSQHWVRTQASLDLNPWSVPDPDLAVIAGSPRDNSVITNPTNALLVVEVSDTTLGYDRHRKASLYAKAGIADYWIVNPRGNQLEVRRQPGPNHHPRYGHGYGSVTILGPTDFACPLAAAHARIAVADMLP